MASKGLILDEQELSKKGIDYDRATKLALEQHHGRPVEQQLVEMRMLHDEVAGKLELVREHIDAETLTGMEATIDGMSAAIRRLEKICRRRAKQMSKAEKKTDVARERLVAQLGIAAEKIPDEGDSPVIELGRQARRAVAQHDRLKAEEDDFRKASAGASNHELVENGFRWLNNLMEDDYKDAKIMGFSREDCAKFYEKLTAMQAKLDAEDKVKKIANDPVPPIKKDAADQLLAQMDAKGRKAIYLMPDDILGKKKGN